MNLMYGVSFAKREIILLFGTRYLSIILIHPRKRKWYKPFYFRFPDAEQCKYVLTHWWSVTNFFGFIKFTTNDWNNPR